MAGVFWRGADGNVYGKGSDFSGVRNFGGGREFIAGVGQYGSYKQIADPNQQLSGNTNATNDSSGLYGQFDMPAAPGSPSFSATGDAPAGPSQAQLDPLLASLGSLDEILANRNNQSQAEYERALASYNAQDALDKQSFDQNTQQNEQTLTSNNQRANLNAANAGSGLRGVLSSLGGLAGSGADVVRRLVGLAANQDAGAARETFDTNATNLGQAWGRAEQQQRQRREDANSTLFNNKQNNEAGVLQSRQSIFQQLAQAYGDQAPEGRDYAAKAAALAAPIAATSRASVAPYQAASSAFSPGAIQQYLAGTQNLEASAAGNASTVPVNSPLFASQKKKEQLVGVA